MAGDFLEVVAFFGAAEAERLKAKMKVTERAPRNEKFISLPRECFFAVTEIVNTLVSVNALQLLRGANWA